MAKRVLSNVPAGSYVGKVYLAGGGTNAPFYAAKLRAALRKRDVKTDLPKHATDVAGTTVGLRALALGAAPVAVKEPEHVHQVHVPSLLRVHGGAVPGTGSLHIGAEEGAIDAPPGRQYGDQLVCPLAPGWIEQDYDLSREDHPKAIVVPTFRLLGGDTRVRLRIENKGVGKLLGIKDGRMFGLLQLTLADPDYLDLGLVAEGIEFDGALPDPSRLDGTPAMIAGRFRLEYDDRAKDGRYYLRLVGGEKSALGALEARIGATFADLAQEPDAPLLVSMDLAPSVPPLLWPLELKSKVLRLIDAGVAGDAVMEIDPAKVTVQLRSKSSYPGESVGLATVIADRIAWTRGAAGFGIRIEAGKASGSGSDIKVAFDKAADKQWTIRLAETVGGHDVTVPLYAHADRMRDMYQRAGALAADMTQAPYLYLPLERGCLQLAMPLEVTTAPGPSPSSVLTGRLVAATQAGDDHTLSRAVRIDDAGALTLDMAFAIEDRRFVASGASLMVYEARAALRGFLFAFETSPTAVEGLPDLRRGPAATRELTLHMRSNDNRVSLQGRFDWDAKSDAWSLKLDPVVLAKMPHHAWLAPARNPFITSHALTRSVAAATEPSVSRGLVPLTFKGGFTLRAAAGQMLPALENVTGTWEQLFEDSADRLILPTLAGLEFVPGAASVTPSLTAALRWDHPLLDELFAWSDPPQQSEAPPVPAVPVLARTSLDPDGMHEVWVRNRHRLALTRTQAAYAVDSISAGAEHQVDITTLVQPYHWNTTLKVDLDQPYGSYQLANMEYELDGAVAGLDNAAFGVDEDGNLVAHGGSEGDADRIDIAGSAASVFERDELHWDSRGLGLGAMDAGLRTAGVKSEAGTGPTLFGLKTLAVPVTFDSGQVTQADDDWMRFGRSLHFYARDLPVADARFAGDTNPLEGPFGLTGQAFLPEHLGYALHEWRFFGDARELYDGSKPAQQWEHDIAVGPFRFKPLRLREASWSEGSDYPALRIVGALWLALGEGEQGREGPFGADHVYRNADLFELTLTPGAGGAWAHAWNGVKITRADPNAPKFEARDPTLRCDLTLLDAKGSGIPYTAPVAATLEMNINKRSATLHARLFGSDLQIPASATLVKDGRVVLTFTLPAPAAGTRPTSVSLADIALKVTIDASGATLSTAGVLIVMPDAHSGADKQRALALFSGDVMAWRWLALDAATCDKRAASGYLQIDHATGALSGEWSGGGTCCTPLFGFVHKQFEASGFIRAYAAALAPGGAASLIGMASAWMRVECRGKQAGSISHVLLEDGVNRDHGLILDSVSTFASAIEWPLDGILKDRAGGAELDLDADPWFDPGVGKPVLNPRVRHLAIAAEGRSATHLLTLRLQGQRIEAGQLAWTGSEVTVSSPVRMLAVGEHVLSQGKRKSSWSALDYVTVTTATAMSAEPGDALYFAPRYQVGEFRGKDDDKRIPWPAFVPLPLALAGLHDPGLRQFLWKDLIPKDPKQLAPPVFMGGTVLQMRLAGEQSMLAVMPWLRLDERQARLRQRGGWWRTAACELWAPHSLGAMESLRLFRVGADVSAPAMAAQFSGAGMAQAANGAGLVDQLPVEQAFFEKWNGSKGLALVKDDLASAPFFLRALLAIARRWHLDASADAQDAAERTFRWDVATVHPGLLASGEPGAVRVEVHAAKQTAPAYEDPAALVAADLVVLSRSRASRLARYRMRPRSASMSGLNAALTSRALDVDRTALLAIEETNAAGPQAPLFALVPLGLDSVLPRRQRAALPPDRLAPSAALGWPSDTGLAGLDRLGPVIGAELPVLSSQAGFAARFQRFGWPALAVRAGEAGADFPTAAPAAFYLSFANRVAFAHNTALPFEGPAARHLLPSPVRRRVPVASSLAEALPKAEVKGGPRLAEPMVLPAIERGTLGRRPGVMEVAVASLTVPGDDTPFDSGYSRFGAPGNSGPLAAQQLRTPRSPALPRDADDRLAASETGKQQLDFRRRTYLSVHDLLESGELAPFTADGSAFDVLRVGDVPVRWKIGFAGQSSIGPDWNGRLGVAIDIAGSDKEGNDKLVPDGARLEIGSLVLPLALDTTPMKGARFSWTCGRLDAARAALRGADADTPMRLVFGLRKPDAPPADQLPKAPQTSCSLPLLLDPGNRAVLPVRLHTIAFGDPSYDRQLGSPTASAVLEVKEERLLLAADRKQYDGAALLYLAGGRIERTSGLFDEGENPPSRMLRLTRLRPSGKPGLPVLATKLTLADVSPTQGRYPIKGGQPVQIALAQLRVAEESGSERALRPGDNLLLEMEYAEDPAKTILKDLQLVVEIVAEPVIAPAPSVFSVLASNEGDAWKNAVLHAAGPLPQRIEFVDLVRDLALGHVRRRALFVWRWAAAGGADSKQEVVLVKFDRSGGAQLPVTQAKP